MTNLIPFILLGRPLNVTRAMKKYKGSKNKCEAKKEEEQ